MSTLKHFLRAAALGLALIASGTAHAGRSCEDAPLDVATVKRSMLLAEHTARRLDESGATVVVLARAGQDLSRYGLTWSHLGFAYREARGEPWRIVHKLNQCATSVAAVYRQGLGDFFLDRMFRYEAGFVVLSPEAQARLLPVLSDNARVTQWHTAPYSMVAYPWAETYQQSNQWAIETLAGVMEPAATTRRHAQAWLQLHVYQPATLRLDALTRLGARMTAANVAFDDHPNEKRFSDRIETATVDSVFVWLQRSRLGGEVLVLR